MLKKQKSKSRFRKATLETDDPPVIASSGTIQTGDGVMGIAAIRKLVKQCVDSNTSDLRQEVLMLRADVAKLQIIIQKLQQK